MTKFLKGSHLAGVASAALTLVAFQPAFAQSGPADDPQSVTTSGNANRTVTDASDVVVINGIAYRDRTADTAPVLVYDTDYFQRFEPLPKASLYRDHYEAMTGADALLLALLAVHTTENKSNVEVPISDVDR